MQSDRKNSNGKRQTPLSMIARVALLVALFMCTLPDEVKLLGFQEPNDLHFETAKPHCLINLSALTAVSLNFLILNIGGE